MFDSILRLLGFAPGFSDQDSFRQLNEVAPLKPEQAAMPGENVQKSSSFIRREAILDRNERIAGYEFALGQKVQSRLMDKSALIRRVYDEAMLGNLAPLGVSSLLGGRSAFIRLSLDSLRSPLLAAIAHPNMVIMIAPRPLAEVDLAALRDSLAHVAGMGFKLGWSICRSCPEYAEFLQQAAYVEVDTTAMDGIQLKALMAELRAANPAQKLIASRLQTSDDFKYCFERRFDHFMGPFVTSRENWHPAKGDVNYLPVFQALEMIRAGAEFDAIAECLRTDPVLTFKLLRYINSPGIGLQQKINEIQQALMLLGRERFYRWLSLLLFDSKKPGFHENVIREQALTRGRLMEMLAGKGQVPAKADQLFLIGLFSLMNLMLDLPLEDVLKQVALPEAVASALRGEAGPLYDALALAVVLESDNGEMEAAATQCGLEAAEVTGMMIEALAWAQEIVSVS